MRPRQTLWIMGFTAASLWGLADSPAQPFQQDSRPAEDAAAAPETVAHPSRSNHRFFGFLRLEASAIQDDPQVDYIGRNDGFILQNARFGVESSISDEVRVVLSVDGAVDERDDPNAVEGRLRVGLRDAYADVVLHPKATLRAARFKALFDIEEATSLQDMTFIDRAISSRGVVATEGFEVLGMGVRRSLGVSLRSMEAMDLAGLAVGYEFSVQNGNGDFDSVNDNNALAVNAALLARSGTKTTLLAAARFNQRTEGEIPFRRDEEDLAAALALRHWASFAKLTVQLLGRRTGFPTTAGPAEQSFGVHAEAVLPVPGVPWLEAGYRYAFLDPSNLIPSDRVQEHTAGVNINIKSRAPLRLQINATHVAEQAGRDLSNDRLQALLQVVM